MPASSIFKDNYVNFLKLGYSPLARFGEKSWPKAWSEYCLALAPEETLKRWAEQEYAMIALACGYAKLTAIDVDTNDQVKIAAVLKALPQCRVARFGSKGFALLARYIGKGECRFSHIYTGEGDKKQPLVEIKGTGQNITVPPSIHYGTGRPYYWMDPVTGTRIEFGAPALEDLPEIDDTDLERLRIALKDWTSPPRRDTHRRPDFDPAKITKTRYTAWYRAGLANAKTQLSALTEGRPSALFRSVCSLGAGVHHNCVSKAEFEDTYLDACEVNGLSRREGRHAILATIDSGLRFAIDDELPDLGESASRKKTGKNKPNGGAHHTDCHDSQDEPEECSGNGYDAEAGEALKEDSRPVIDIRGELHEVVRQAEEALFKSKVQIYQQASVLVEPVKCSLVDNKGDIVHIPAIRPINSAGMRCVLSEHIQWEKYDGRSKKMVMVNPPPEIAATIVARKGQGPYWRVLAGVSASPMLRYDGTIVMKPGYDEQSGWFLQENGLPNIAPFMRQEPTEDDARKALEFLTPLLDEFPFIDSLYPNRKPKDTASYSVALSAILTLLARPMMNVVPGHAARATEAGTGKTYLFNIAAAIGLGTRCPVIAQSDEKAETEKRFATLMLSGSQVICVDNVNGDLQSDLLGQAISEDLVQVRTFGKLEGVTVANRFLVYVTGNNLAILGDLNRRILICEMDAVLEHPWERPFEHDPVSMVLQDRAKYIAACLTIIRAHHLEGYPGAVELAPLVTFDRWTQVVRGALVWLGLRDPVESMETLKKADPQRVEHANFVNTFAELFEPDFSKHVTVLEIVEESNRTIDDGKDEARKRMKEILRDYGDKHGVVSSRRVGKWLSRITGRRFGDLRLKGTNEKRPMMEYWVERLP